MVYVQSFAWCAVDVQAQLTRSMRVYSDSIIRPSGTSMPLSVQPQSSIAASAELNGRTFKIVFERRLRYVWHVSTYHDFEGVQDHVQVTWLACPGMSIGLNEQDQDWEDFLRLLENPAASNVLRQQRATMSKGMPIAYSMRGFEGVMSDCEMIHQAVAASFFRTFCTASLPDAAWVPGDDS